MLLRNNLVFRKMWKKWLQKHAHDEDYDSVDDEDAGDGMQWGMVQCRNDSIRLHGYSGQRLFRLHLRRQEMEKSGGVKCRLW